MDLQLQDQHAVVFGCARGIGRAIAEAFAAEGCKLGLVDVSPAVEQTAKQIGDNCHAATADVSDNDQINQALDALTAKSGPICHVVYAVGIGSGKFGFPFWNLDPEDWPRVVDVNLTCAARVAHAVAPQLIKQAGNTMLFLVSVAAQIGSPTDPPYSAAKAGLVNFMQCAAKDFAPYGVRANALSPGMVQTELNKSVWAAGQELLPEAERQSYEEWGQAKISKNSPLGRWQKPDEFGSMAVYLASHRARNITGQTINIDGGQVMHS
ncbi:MAG: oxidoreductase [Verrucomicrobiales bacterium]|nr:oxidoreductase [Verrucomicrobiales bacterium]